MAMLTDAQVQRRIKREKQKNDALKRKMEIQEKKELYGENWKEKEQQVLQQTLEKEIGSDKLPKIYDRKDLYDFFDPIVFYRDANGDILKLEFAAFEEAEEQYKKALLNAQKELNESLEGDEEIELSIDKENTQDNENQDDIKEEVNEHEQKNEETIIEVDENGNEVEVKKSESQEVQLAKQGEESSEIADGVKNKDTPRHRARKTLNQYTAKYFNRFTPMYNKHVCTCCGMPKKVDEFYITSDVACNNRVDKNGFYHMSICKDCLQKELLFFYYERAGKNIELAMQLLCASNNIYWDVDYFYGAKKDFEDNGRNTNLIYHYISFVNRIAPGKTFVDSPMLVDEQYNSANRIITGTTESDAPYDWDKEDAQNKKTVLKMVGYDPFEAESDEDKKYLYRDLLNILDAGMENDFVKFQAGVQIVYSFFKLRKMNEKQTKMEREGALMADQKALSDLKAKELKSITDFSKDNGFSERYATAKAKGDNTLTGIMNKMNEMKYEKAMLNRYDIDTSATISQVADASFSAIFKQLGMGEGELWKTTQDQFAEISKLRRELADTKEELRKTKYKIAEIKLLEKEKEKEKTYSIEEEDEY